MAKTNAVKTSPAALTDLLRDIASAQGVDPERCRRWTATAAKLLKTGVDAWILIIEHRYGTNASVHTSEEDAYAELFSYVDEWWKQEGLTGPVPAVADDAINRYFEHCENESWSIQPATLLYEH